jgi:Helix-turn-helix domain
MLRASAEKSHYTITEAAKTLGVSRQAIHDAITRGIIKATKGTVEITRIVKTMQRGWTIPAKELRKYRPSEIHMWVGKKKARSAAT